MTQPSKEIEEIGRFFGDVFEFVDSHQSLEATKAAIDSIGLRNFFEYDVRNKIVADIGCGYGRATLEMLLAGAGSVTAVDVSEKQLLRTKEILRQSGLSQSVKFLSASADELPLPDRAFDVVISLGVIHHLPSFTKGLDELCRITKPSGIVFLATLGKRGIIPQARRIIRSVTRRLPYASVGAFLNRIPVGASLKYIVADTLWAKYYHQYSLKELRRLFAQRGFEIIRVGDIYKSKSARYRFLQGEGYIHLVARRVAS